MTARQPVSSVRGPKGDPRSETLRRWLQLLAGAVLTLVCAGVFGATEGNTSLGAASEAIASARPSRASHALHDSGEREDLDLDACEVDLDDDDDVDGHHRLPGFADYADITCEHARPIAGPSRGTAPARDPSRFAIGDGFARGPPA